MLRMGDYPPGVTGDMIDGYFGSDCGSCATCSYFHDNACGKREEELIAEIGEEAFENLSDYEYEQACHVEDDDGCEDYDYDDRFDPEPYDPYD